MSVINSMLKDLDKRQQPHSLESLNVASVQYQAKPTSRLPWVLLALVSILLIAGSIYSYMQLSNATTPISKGVTNTRVAQADGAVANTSKLSEGEGISTASTTPLSEPVQGAEPLVSQLVSVTAADAISSELDLESSATQEANVLISQESQVPEIAVAKAPAIQAIAIKESASVEPTLDPVQDLAQVSDPAPVSEPTIARAASLKAIPRESSMAVTEVQVSNEQLAQRRYSLATAAEERGLLSDAIVYYSEVLALVPDMHKARRQLAALYYGQSRLDLASETLVKGIAIFPLEYDYSLLLARVQQAAGKTQLAMASLTQIPDGSARDVQKWTMQSSLAQSIGKHELSEDSYRKLLRVAPGQAKWWMGLGYALDAQQEYVPAKQAYQQALSAQGLSKQAQDYIENRLVQLGDSE
ncbi:MSHA biogenesis protein MshN [Shewanella eurypsychrophilus]|uniref:MSHA biogenesis protein MshN n=1 Tax=Shewanella eurypsychrophilus TaxID=2593656 RepID=A0ABX6VAZ6_9GAMM|nr:MULTISPECIES: tetratricopeptide repeat protein [Shewanella]QFU24651.1 MSHA biogenesis protein MshN [Shewanella sp. YLB-09]QPG59845.1 MSHA biogenesis protein MshN [Shewanella eurypsychrophilus]